MKSLSRLVDLINRNTVSTSSVFDGLNHKVTSSLQSVLWRDFINMGEFMKENKLADLSIDFAVSALSFADKIDGHYSLKNQFERASTSIGANIREANYAQSSADFISKLQIALKECYETEYWLELFTKANIVSQEETKNLLHACGEIRRMLVSSITTLKNKN